MLYLEWMCMKYVPIWTMNVYFFRINAQQFGWQVRLGRSKWQYSRITRNSFFPGPFPLHCEGILNFTTFFVLYVSQLFSDFSLMVDKSRRKITKTGDTSGVRHWYSWAFFDSCSVNLRFQEKNSCFRWGNEGWSLTWWPGCLRTLCVDFCWRLVRKSLALN